MSTPRPAPDEVPADRRRSPYVSIYVARTQGELMLKVLKAAAEGKAPSNPIWRAISAVERSLEGRD